MKRLPWRYVGPVELGSGTNMDKRGGSFRLASPKHELSKSGSGHAVGRQPSKHKLSRKLTQRASSNLGAAMLALELGTPDDDDETAAPHAPDGSTFAASYWKQQVLGAKRKLAAVIDRHTRDVYTIHHKLHRPMELTLPQADVLERARDAKLRQIVSKPAAHVDMIEMDVLVGAVDGGRGALEVPSTLFPQIHAHVVDQLARCRVYQAHTLAGLARQALPASSMVDAYDRSIQHVHERHHALSLQLTRLDTTHAVDAADLKQYLRFLETKHAVTKLASRFAHRMHWLCHSHRGPIQRRMLQILAPPSAAAADDDESHKMPGNPTTSTPPRFLLDEDEVDAAIGACLAKLGIQDSPHTTPDDRLAQLRREFPTLFARHAPPTDAVPRGAPPTETSSGLFPHVSPWQRQQRLKYCDGRASNCMVLEAELKFCSATDAQFVLDRLEGLAGSHVKRALLTVDPVAMRTSSVALSDRLVLTEPPNPPTTVPEAKLKTYYILRLLVVRQCKYRMLQCLNYLRSVETHVLEDAHDAMAATMPLASSDAPSSSSSSPASRSPSAKQHGRHYDRIDHTDTSLRVLNDAGDDVLYAAALDDLSDMEQTMLSIGSAVSSLDERAALKPGTERKVVAVVDRVAVLADLYECETWYLQAKVKLARRLMDNLYLRAFGADAQTTMAQDLVDLVAARPLVDFATERYFWDAYASQVMALEVQREMLDGVCFDRQDDDDALYTTAEAVVVLRAATRGAIASMNAALGSHVGMIERLAMVLAVSEHAIVCWHVVQQEDLAYVATSAAVDGTVFANYYAKDGGAGTLIEQAVGHVYRRHATQHVVDHAATAQLVGHVVHPGDGPTLLPDDAAAALRVALDTRVHSLGASLVDVWTRAVVFFELECDLSDRLYAVALLEEIHAAQTALVQGDDCVVVGRPPTTLLDQSPAIDALSFVSVTRTTSMPEWIERHVADDVALRWLALAVQVQDVERVYLDQALQFNAMFLDPVVDFQATHRKLTARHIAKFLASPSLDQNHKNYLAQVQSVLGQRALHDKVAARIAAELKVAASLCLPADATRHGVRRLVGDRVDLNPTLDHTALVHEYTAALVESVKVEGLLRQLNSTLAAMRRTSRELPASTINPFVIGGFCDRDTLDAWLVRELAPMEEQLGVAASTAAAVDGVKFAKGETIESLWCGPQGDVVNVHYIPHPVELVKRFATTTVAHGALVLRASVDAEPDIRRLVRLYTALVDVVGMLGFRAALQRTAYDEHLGGSIRDLLSQMQHDCVTRDRHAAAAPGSTDDTDASTTVDATEPRRLNDVMLAWCLAKRDVLAAMRSTAVKTIVGDILAETVRRTPGVACLLGEGQALAAMDHFAPAAAVSFVMGLSNADCAAARGLWKLLEARAGAVAVKGMDYLRRFDAFHALRAYFLDLTHAPDRLAQLHSVIAVEAAVTEDQTASTRRPSTSSADFYVPDAGELSHAIDNLRNYIELQFVEEDTHVCRQAFADVLKSLHDASSPRRAAVTSGQAKLNVVAIFAENVRRAVLDTHDASAVPELCRNFLACHDEDMVFQHAATHSLNTQLRHRIKTLEETQRKLELEIARRDKIASEVLATNVVDKAYKLIFELEEARHAIEMADEELEVQKARIVSEIRSEYDTKLRDLSLELIQTHGQFEEYRSAVQNDLRMQLHDVQKSAVGKFIETGIPMQIKSQLVRSMRTNVEIEKIMDENTALKQTLLKLRTMYDLKDAATQAAHERAEALLSAQLAKANLVFHQKNQVDAQLVATQTQVVALQKDILRLQAAAPASARGAAAATVVDVKPTTVGTVVQVSKFAHKLLARKKAKMAVAAAVGDPVETVEEHPAMDENDDKDDDAASPEPSPGKTLEDDGVDNDDDDASLHRTRAHYIRSAHHLNRELRRLRAQLHKEVKLKTTALEQLHAARGQSQLLLEHENAKLQTELAESQRRYVAAVHEVGELQQLVRPEPGGHTSARKRPPSPSTTTGVASCFPCPPPDAARARPRTSIPKTKMANERPSWQATRPSTGGSAVTRTAKFKASLPNNQDETMRPKSAAATLVPRKSIVLRREEDQSAVEGTTHPLAPRMRPLYR
ncbi:Aste57867_20001 [Aphanomyces stellatus]|uniref:Aste57867_20001 protein n=1 Tax=Aphanomyces stellatus TaxID=120398 RepID=A0A485LIL1_9STRA|nr:hypothetical protein As57867_019935 [Aphanomyces stellatus]VFT96698.1 Aste57867_20001 [Aphanomyces stellatus]